MEVFRNIPIRTRRSSSPKPSGNTAIISCTGLITHRARFSPSPTGAATWPGLVGMLNLNGSLTKAGVPYRSLWSEDFTDEYFLTRPARVAQRPAQSSMTPPTSATSAR